MNSARTPSPAHGVRHLLAALPVLGAIALILSGLNLWWGYGDARRSLYSSQASVVIGRLDEAVVTQLFSDEGAGDSAALQQVLEAIEPVGGLAFAVFHPDGQLAAASDSEMAALNVLDGEQLTLEADGTVTYVTSIRRIPGAVGEEQIVRDNAALAVPEQAVAEPSDGFVGRLPPPPPMERPGPAGLRGPPGPGRPGGGEHEARSGRPGRFGGPPPPLPLAVRFRPVAEEAIGWRFRTALAINGVAAILLLIAGGWVLAELRRRDALMAELATKRHLSSLGVMSATLAHEIRNPLASIKGHAQLLRETAAEASPQWKKSDRIVQESRRLEMLVTSLLDFVRSGRTEPALVDLRAVLVAGIGQQNLDGGRVRLDVEAAPDAWALDATQIERVVQNLVDNALAATDTGEVVVCSWSESGRLWVSVRDHGPGIPEELMETLFEPFVTGRLHGTGLGLSISRQLVSAHGGEIEATNPPDGGAEFRFWLEGGTRIHGKNSNR